MLIRHIRKTGSFLPESSNEIVDQVGSELNKTIAELTPQFMVKESTVICEAASNRLIELAGNFAESAEGKLEAIRAAESTMSSSQRDVESSDEAIVPSRQRRLGVKFGLGLVGMLRPPGFGNIQGYIAHNTGLFGVTNSYLRCCFCWWSLIQVVLFAFRFWKMTQNFQY